MVSGRDSSTSTGRTTALTRPKTSAVSSSQKTAAHLIPGTSWVAAHSAKAVMKVRAQKPMPAVSANAPAQHMVRRRPSRRESRNGTDRWPVHAGHRATLAGCAALLLWAFLALWRGSPSPLPPLLLTGLAFAVGGRSACSVVAARGRLGALRQPPLVWLHGVGGLAGYHALYFAALALAPPVEANLLNYTWPLLIVLLAAPLRGLRLGPRRLAGVGLGAPGAALLLAGGAQGRFGGGALLAMPWRSPPG